MEDIKIFLSKAFRFGKFLNLAVDLVCSGSRSLGNLVKINQRVEVFVDRSYDVKDLSLNPRCFRSSEYCQNTLVVYFAEMLMSESSDRSSGNRIVRTVCKVYNVIYVSNMKGYGLLERDTRGASKNLSLIYQHCKRGIFRLRLCQLRKMNEALTLRETQGSVLPL